MHGVRDVKKTFIIMLLRHNIDNVLRGRKKSSNFLKRGMIVIQAYLIA